MSRPALLVAEPLFGEGTPGPLAPALRPDVEIVAEPRRGLVQTADRTTANGVDQLVDAIEFWGEHWNDGHNPSIWKTPTDEILAKVRRPPTDQANSSTDH